MSQREENGGRPQRARVRPRPRLRNQLLFGLGILFLAAGAFYTALVVATQIDQIFFPSNEIRLPGLSKLPGVDSGGSSTDVARGRFNVLVLGLDRRPREGNAPARTDTIFVVTVDPSNRTARGIGIPRDLYVDIPTRSGGSFKERVNTAYVYGETSGYPGGGAALARKTVENALGIKIDYHVIIDFEGFKKVIDLLGGIDVDVPTEVNDPYYSETEALGDYYPCVFRPGSYHMNGSDALCYARVRRNSSDLDRIQRQQRIIFATLEKASRLNVLDPANVVSLWKRYKDTVTTDISDFQVPGFAALAARIDPNRMAFLSLGAATVPYTTSEGAAVLLPSEAGIKQIVDALLSDQRLIEEAAVVEIQNGTDIEGRATKAAEYLQSLGIPHESLIPANSSAPLQKTEIVDFTGKRYTAERIAGWLGVSRDRIRQGGPADAALRHSGADIVVLLGPDAKIESAAVAQPSR
jgi:LCP family protein required for cell wall assembly